MGTSKESHGISIRRKHPPKQVEISYYLFYENQFNKYLSKEKVEDQLFFGGGGRDQFIVLGGLMFVDFMSHSYPGIYIPTDELI